MFIQDESDKKMVNVLAKNLFNQIKLQGHDHKVALALASQLIELSSQDLKEKTQIDSLAS